MEDRLSTLNATFAILATEISSLEASLQAAVAARTPPPLPPPPPPPQTAPFVVMTNKDKYVDSGAARSASSKTSNGYITQQDRGTWVLFDQWEPADTARPAKSASNSATAVGGCGTFGLPGSDAFTLSAEGITFKEAGRYVVNAIIHIRRITGGDRQSAAMRFKVHPASGSAYFSGAMLNTAYSREDDDPIKSMHARTIVSVGAGDTVKVYTSRISYEDGGNELLAEAGYSEMSARAIFDDLPVSTLASAQLDTLTNNVKSQTNGMIADDGWNSNLLWSTSTTRHSEGPVTAQYGSDASSQITTSTTGLKVAVAGLYEVYTSVHPECYGSALGTGDGDTYRRSVAVRLKKKDGDWLGPIANTGYNRGYRGHWDATSHQRTYADLAANDEVQMLYGHYAQYGNQLRSAAGSSEMYVLRVRDSPMGIVQMYNKVDVNSAGKFITAAYPAASANGATLPADASWYQFAFWETTPGQAKTALGASFGSSTMVKSGSPLTPGASDIQCDADGWVEASANVAFTAIKGGPYRQTLSIRLRHCDAAGLCSWAGPASSSSYIRWDNEHKTCSCHTSTYIDCKVGDKISVWVANVGRADSNGLSAITVFAGMAEFAVAGI